MRLQYEIAILLRLKTFQNFTVAMGGPEKLKLALDGGYDGTNLDTQAGLGEPQFTDQQVKDMVKLVSKQFKFLLVFALMSEVVMLIGFEYIKDIKTLTVMVFWWLKYGFFIHLEQHSEEGNEIPS